MVRLTAVRLCEHLGIVEEAPLHAIALRQVRDGALQHWRVAGADDQVSQVEANALEVQVFLPLASHTPVSPPPIVSACAGAHFFLPSVCFILCAHWVPELADYQNNASIASPNHTWLFATSFEHIDKGQCKDFGFYPAISHMHETTNSPLHQGQHAGRWQRRCSLSRSYLAISHTCEHAD